VLAGQRSLFGSGHPEIDPALAGLRRRWLDADSWLDHAPGWVTGHQALFEALEASTRWQRERLHIYERTMEVPRLVARLPENGPGHPLLAEMARALQARYGQAFVHTSLALYRDGRDSVAWHGDRVARELLEAVVATVSLGEPRRFLVRPKGGGRSLALSLGWGDLLVMGGASQRTWQHAIPKVARAGARLVVMLRPQWGADR
jgi:alkylated DNA repair dioxygenase AlkB